MSRGLDLGPAPVSPSWQSAPLRRPYCPEPHGRLPGGFVMQAPSTLVQHGMRPDLLPLAACGQRGETLAALVSSSGALTQYGIWSSVRGWEPWSAYWEAVLLALWLAEPHPQRYERTLIYALTVLELHCPQFETQSDAWLASTRAQNILRLFDASLVTYPLLTGESRNAGTDEAMAHAARRERSRLWRTVGDGEGPLQLVVKAVYSLQAMRQGLYEVSANRPWPALPLAEVLREHWSAVPEPLRDDRVAMALARGSETDQIEEWLAAAQQQRQAGQFERACRAMCQAWVVSKGDLPGRHLAWWQSDAASLPDPVWQRLLELHGVSPQE